jgi:uncharacterized protein YjbI with pentapeptide repeats
MRAIREWWRWFHRGGWRWAILAVLIVAFLWFVPQLQGKYFSHKVPATERPALVNEYRRTWAQIVGGFGLLLGLYFTWRRIEISQRELEATRDQQVTERFTRAIDQIGAIDDKGNKKLEIRLGGIYALERIAADSLAMENYPGRDYSTVMEVLTAYVRENTRQAPEASDASSDTSSISNEASNDADESEEQSPWGEALRPTADIQAILDVLGRAQTRAPEEYYTRLDLHEAKLQGAKLREVNLQETDLREADLREADFRGANLRGANLQHAKLLAYLEEAKLRGAQLYGANLQGAILHGADLREAYFLRANLQGADLQGSNLRETILYGVNLRGADLQGADLQDAKVADEQLADALSLQGATMPDGQILQGDEVPDGPTFKEWLQGGEGRGKDVENE